MDKNRKVVAIVQARMGSARLPGKSLRQISGKPMIELVLARVALAKSLDDIILATTKNKEDDVLCAWAKSAGIAFYRGDDENVLERFYDAALLRSADIVVRITADDPLKDAEFIDFLVGVVNSDVSIKYATNSLMPSFPEGLDVEVFTFEALRWAHECATLYSDKEHVTPYLKRELSSQEIFSLTSEDDFSNHRWTVDHEADVFFMEQIFSNFGETLDFSWTQVIELLRMKPELLMINQGIAPRNQGYLSSVEKEKNAKK